MLKGSVVLLVMLVSSECTRSRLAPNLQRLQGATAGDSGFGSEIDSENYLLIEITTDNPNNGLFGYVTELGMKESSIYGRVMSGKFPVDQLEILAQDSRLISAYTPAPALSSGNVTSEGDARMGTDIARALLEFQTGRGLFTPSNSCPRVRVGIISDSYDCKGGAALDKSTGDLPHDARALLEGNCPATDEGRAMMQIVHDVVPQADILFFTAFSAGQPGFVNAILSLKDAGCDVVVDDAGFKNEPVYADGMIAQAVDHVVSEGVAYFSAAGNANFDGSPNSARPQVYRAPFVDDGSGFHSFGPGVNSIEIDVSIVTSHWLQWTQPYNSISGPPGCQSDLDIVINGHPSNYNNLGGDPIDYIVHFNNGPGTVTVQFKLISGEPPTEIFFLSGGVFSGAMAIQVNNPSTYGHSSARGSLSTAAVNALTGELEGFSSRGPSTIYFDENGKRLRVPEVRMKPDITAPDGGLTTFFGRLGLDGYRFLGTSAAAPHAAGLAALMIQASNCLLKGQPEEVSNILKATSNWYGQPGWDKGWGMGSVNGPEASAIATSLSRTTMPHENGNGKGRG